MYTLAFYHFSALEKGNLRRKLKKNFKVLSFLPKLMVPKCGKSLKSISRIATIRVTQGIQAKGQLQGQN
jgi:hypothetical protein